MARTAVLDTKHPDGRQGDCRFLSKEGLQSHVSTEKELGGDAKEILQVPCGVVLVTGELPVPLLLRSACLDLSTQETKPHLELLDCPIAVRDLLGKDFNPLLQQSKLARLRTRGGDGDTPAHDVDGAAERELDDEQEKEADGTACSTSDG